MSFQSIIIIGGSSKARQDKALELRAEKNGTITDTMQLPEEPDEKSIKIEHIRKLTGYFSLPPYNAPIKTALIMDMENASLETQHALLKLLEEPPSYALIILTAAKKEVFLPTIQSRVTVIKLPREKSANWQAPYNQLTDVFEKGSGERLSFASQVSSSRETAASWLKDTIEFVRLGLLHIARTTSLETKPLRLFLKTATRALTALEQTTTSPRLLIENLLLDLPRLPRLDPKDK